MHDNVKDLMERKLIAQDMRESEWYVAIDIIAQEYFKSSCSTRNNVIDKFKEIAKKRYLYQM